MKKSAMFLGLMMLSTFIFAQRKGDQGDRSARQAERMKTELGLDAVQYNAVKAINEEFAEKFLKLRGDSTLSKESKQNQMKAIRSERAAAIEKVLTEEQKTKWVAYRSDRSRKYKAGMARHQGEHAKRMQKDLSLSDEQTSKIKAIDKEFAEKFRSLRNDSTMARENSREHGKKLRAEYLSKTKSVLTEEQFKLWERQRAERKRKKF